MKVNDYVMVKFNKSINAPVSAHKTHKVVEVFADGKLLLQGHPEPLDSSLFDKMKIGKVKAY
ncbi:hypothetical protein phD2B_002 [Lelliottia phage phD2B]|uniref:Uncharacterized protein n=1 Tax=Lelliottia phage phD2B TaxID=1542498 RepID=A0A088FWW2_9CAUD|nr:hypothetical protein phD2B_002 [Lelliottia phage phD2B]AIM51229.1 hypothetical protein phD2B_002 [Lelliottia phage phD2B]